MDGSSKTMQPHTEHASLHAVSPVFGRSRHFSGSLATSFSQIKPSKLLSVGRAQKHGLRKQSPYDKRAEG